jgi:hypothetical protein
MITPRIALVAHEDRAGQFIFVAIPDQRGRYLRTDKSVALVPCPQCEAATGEPCYSPGGDGWSATTHHRRRSMARTLFGHVLRADDVLRRSEPPEMPAPVPDEWMEAAS